MKVEALEPAGVMLLTPTQFNDARGKFVETWQAARFTEFGIPGPFVQDNHSVSVHAGTVRGLHLQLPPFEQGKLVRVVRGRIWDVAVDVRPGSPTFGRHAAAELSAENWRQLWIPAGFLHGFCTLEPDTEVVYKVTAAYDRGSERGVIWNDPQLALPWPVKPGDVLLSEKDKELSRLSDYAGGLMPGA